MPVKLRGGQQIGCPLILVLVEEGGTNRREESAPGAKHIVDRGRLITAADHAVSAFWIAGSCAVIFPLRLRDQLLEGGSVAILQQVTGLLPAEDVVSGIAPGCAFVVPLAHQEREE